MANSNNAAFTLNKKDVVLVQPCEPTPSTILSLSTIDQRPDLNSLCHTIQVYRSADTQQDPASVIQQALSKALIHYYPLAGRIVKLPDGKLAINCNTDGVPFVEAIASCELSSIHYLDGEDVGVAKHLAFEFPDEIGPKQHPLVIKVTKFLCGGFTIGIGLSHTVCDGAGASQFNRALAELASGKSETSVKPVWDREILKGTITKQPMQSPVDWDWGTSAAVSPFMPTTDVAHSCFKVDGQSITRLKMSLMKEIQISNTENAKEITGFTTFESLAAYVWRARARALQLSYDNKTLLIITVGIRRHLGLPEGYYGNAIVDAYVLLTVRELNEKPLSEIVKLIRERKEEGFTTDYIRNSINTFETKLEEFDIEDNGAFTLLTDWKHLGLENLDFGWKEPVNLILAPNDMGAFVGICTFAPPTKFDPSMKGGIRVFSSLPAAAMPKLKQEMEALTLV